MENITWLYRKFRLSFPSTSIGKNVKMA